MNANYRKCFTNKVKKEYLQKQKKPLITQKLIQARMNGFTVTCSILLKYRMLITFHRDLFLLYLYQTNSSKKGKVFIFLQF